MENEGFVMYLSDTTELMLSQDYKERFRAEYWQLETRLNSLLLMLEQWDKGTLPFVPTCPRELYDEQIAAMGAYLKILKKRADLEAVDVSEAAKIDIMLGHACAACSLVDKED